MNCYKKFEHPVVSALCIQPLLVRYVLRILFQSLRPVQKKPYALKNPTYKTTSSPYIQPLTLSVPKALCDFAESKAQLEGGAPAKKRFWV